MKWKYVVLLVSLGWSLKADIINGDFGSGNFTGWALSGSDGNGQILSTFGPYTPTGTNFALLSNGPGQINDPSTTFDATVLTSVPYGVSPGASLSMRVNFVSEEPNDGSGNPDYFAIMVIGLSSMTIRSGAITSGQSSIAGGPIVAPDGSTFVYEDGFVNVTAPLTSFAGQDIRLQFLVADAIDNSFDSGLLIDNVSGVGLTPVSSVPEPKTVTFLLLGVGALLFGAGCKKWETWRLKGHGML